MAKEQQGVKTRRRVEYREPDHYQVIILNDDFTTQEFVVQILMDVFFKNHDEAMALMLAVHNEGQGVAGTYPFDVAQSKAAKATRMARDAGFPLRIIVKPE